MIPGKPRFISYGASYYYAFTEQQGKRLNENGLQLMDDFNAMFYSTPAYNPQNVMYTNNCEFIINDGKLHVMYTNKANDRKFSAPVAGSYNAAPFMSKMTKASNENGLQLMDDFNAMFYSTPAYNPQNVMYTNNCEFIINDGKLHVMYTNKANDRKFSAPVAGSYNAAPFMSKETKASWRPVVGAINSDQVIFDLTAKAFRPYFPQSTAISQFKATVPGAFIDVNNMKSAPVASLEANGGQVYNIMRINGKDSLYVVNYYNVVDDGDLSVGGNSRISLAGCEGISQAKYFASSNAGSAFFYATDNAVYSFSYTSGQTKQLDIYKCAAGEVVTCLYQLPNGGFPTAGCVLWIAIWNTANNTGSLREYEVDPTSGAITTFWSDMFAPDLGNPSIKTGFGKIKSMIIKM